MRRTLTALAGLILAVALGGCGSSGSVDEPVHAVGTEDGTSTSQAAVQESLDSVSEQLRKFSGKDGYGGIAYDLPARSINLYWKGELDPGIQAIIDRVRSDVTVKVHEANFSADELNAASQKINRTKAADGSYEVQSVILEDLDRPTFVYGLMVVAKLGPGADTDEVESTLTRLAGVPVTLSNMGEPTY